MTFIQDTIVGIATALNESGIGIVRVSGNDSISIVNRLYRSNGKRCLKDYDSHTIHYGFIYDNDDLIDEVMVSVFKAPKSYTKEDIVEINCHGGIMVVQKVLKLVIQSGARAAEPGEFTKRAFLNGRIDLSKAEAIMDLIHAKNDFALKASVKQIRGNLYHLIHNLRASILYEIAFIESALDDPEHISLDGYLESLSEKLNSYIDSLSRLYRSSDNGKLLKEGINTVILGKPNSGKSSLLNLLVGDDKAIVTEIAGTTRDVIEEKINISGIGLNIIDTAGIRSTDDIVEQIGVTKAKEYAADADLILYVVDSSVNLDENDTHIKDLLSDKKIIVLLNKSDLPEVVNKESILSHLNCNQNDLNIIRFSTIDGSGLEELERSICNLFFEGKLVFNDEVILTNLRHKSHIKNALDSLYMVKKSIEDGMAEDFLSIDLTDAYTSLGFIIGEEVEEDVVNEIFSKFCMGK